MFHAHRAEEDLTSLARVLPYRITVPGWPYPVSRDDLLGVIRWELMQYVTFGPTYRRAVADELRRALEMFREHRGEEFAHWIAETVTVAAKIRGAEPHDPQHFGTCATPWHVSYETTARRDDVTLCVVNNSWPTGTVRHPVHYGKTFPTREDAHAYAWQHGLLIRSDSRGTAGQR